MEKIKKQLQIILYVWVWLLSFSAADAAEAITDEYWIKKNSTEIILTACGIRNGWKRKTGNGPWYFF